ncbi:TPA: hypothetical protein N0F65_003638 [Lagenidium giganteum]|uniref:Uncharacterized protein n=1 Tax=Lagenidium giganteum TaxID=4803 RepID=A0AAV2YK99_9STRA|nr:TPA: hypothetical protein N0F65_003638 [Lagenidium giganteum]
MVRGALTRSWEADCATAHGKNSIDVLLAWLSKHGNYDRWLGGAKTVKRRRLCVVRLLRCFTGTASGRRFSDVSWAQSCHDVCAEETGRWSDSVATLSMD